MLNILDISLRPGRLRLSAYAFVKLVHGMRF